VEKETNSPKNKDFAKYSEGKVFLMPNNETSQSKIYFFGHGPQLNTDVVPNVRAFNQYFSGSFGGLVMNEIREKNSMAYTAQGVFQNQGILNDPYYFLGFIGTQADKTIQAIDLFMGLVNEMPENPARLTNIKMVLKQGLQSSRPTFRNVTMSYQSWLQQGYTDDPAKTILPQLDAMTFDNILDFYRTQLKAKPLVIGIVGDVKQFDVKALEKYGKVERVSNNKLFN
jgi:zinc protease